MSKHIDPASFLQMPSGARWHPSRLIHKDGCLMWSMALGNSLRIPASLAHEQHICKTAQRLEELSSWLESEDGVPPLLPVLWYDPQQDAYSEGIQAMLHCQQPQQTLSQLADHVLPHESLTLSNDAEHLIFRRC